MIKKVLLFLFVVHQLYVAHCGDFKCYSCKGDCAAKAEVDCADKCCYSAAAALGAGNDTATTTTTAAAPAAARRKRFLSTLAHLDEENGMFLADTHKFKGCCEATTKDDCKNSPGCYTCTKSLCNAGDSGALKLMVTSPAMVMLPVMFCMAFSSVTL